MNERFYNNIYQPYQEDNKFNTISIAGNSSTQVLRREVYFFSE